MKIQKAMRQANHSRRSSPQAISDRRIFVVSPVCVARRHCMDRDGRKRDPHRALRTDVAMGWSVGDALHSKAGDVRMHSDGDLRKQFDFIIGKVPVYERALVLTELIAAKSARSLSSSSLLPSQSDASPRASALLKSAPPG